MARRVLLVVCSDPDRLDKRQAAVHSVGYLSLPAPSISRALFLLHKLRPALVLTDATLVDGPAWSLVERMRAFVPLQRVPVVILGSPTPEEQSHTTGDPYTEVRQIDDGDSAVITGVLEDALGGPRPRHPRAGR